MVQDAVGSVPRNCGGTWVRATGGAFDLFFVKAIEIRFC